MIKDKKKKMWWHRILTFCMAICITGHFTIYIIDFNEYQQNITNIHFDDIDLGSVKDGIYEGECNVGYIYARVQVKIKDSIIVSIKLLEHRNEKGKCNKDAKNFRINSKFLALHTIFLLFNL